MEIHFSVGIDVRPFPVQRLNRFVGGRDSSFDPYNRDVAVAEPKTGRMMVDATNDGTIKAASVVNAEGERVCRTDAAIRAPAPHESPLVANIVRINSPSAIDLTTLFDFLSCGRWISPLSEAVIA